MGIGDSMKKLIGIEEIDDDEITEDDIEEEQERLERERAKSARRAERAERAAMQQERRYQPQEAPVQPARPAAEPRHYATMQESSSFKLLLLEPKTFEECPRLVDALKQKKPVIINLAALQTDIARKIFDFLSGATYALDGNVQKVADNIFIFAPKNVNITGITGTVQSEPEYMNQNARTDASNRWR